MWILNQPCEPNLAPRLRSCTNTALEALQAYKPRSLRKRSSSALVVQYVSKLWYRGYDSKIGVVIREVRCCGSVGKRAWLENEDEEREENKFNNGCVKSYDIPTSMGLESFERYGEVIQKKRRVE